MAKETKKQKSNSLHKTEIQKIYEQQEQQSLIFGPDELIRLQQKTVDRDLLQFEVNSGAVRSLKEIENLVLSDARDCDPMFPNRLPFFKLMYKLLGWEKLDPNNFIKPPVVAYYLKKYIYGRFDKKILPSLLEKHNPLVDRYIKKYKLYQFLNDVGLVLLEQYIHEAIAVMKDSTDWYDFEVKYSRIYNLPERKIFN